MVQFRRLRNIVLSAILCAALAPANVGAASLRMVVQSHPSLGGRCIDLANHQILSGTRVQMWDCNNGPAQIFSYDEASQQLTIGKLCVESWGAGHSQDPVGLGSCDNGLKQRWRVVAAGEYYQIIGVDGLCLDISNVGNENGAPLQVAPCGDATRAARQLWALLEAPPDRQTGAGPGNPAPAPQAPTQAPPAAAQAPPAAAQAPPAAAQAVQAPPAAAQAPQPAVQAPPAAKGNGPDMPVNCQENLNWCSLQVWARNSFPHPGFTQRITFSNRMTLTCTSNGRGNPRTCSLK